eukprot:NODE_3166_length_698_cov_87.223421_g2246_i0.p1 GENE.NODE_3166_length_698_cov_87.223421_g2246_i0~~NODE_3166_length_698_cov_87.223421_g2246_i0.p1  ORF type:complete len:161 (+),score=13.27 NODE_3166_length_698_cov_87.223421_g2246_i0:24-485(+)
MGSAASTACFPYLRTHPRLRYSLLSPVFTVARRVQRATAPETLNLGPSPSYATPTPPLPPHAHTTIVYRRVQCPPALLLPHPRPGTPPPPRAHTHTHTQKQSHTATPTQPPSRAPDLPSAQASAAVVAFEGKGDSLPCPAINQLLRRTCITSF